ncbi:hypothetical protein GCM10028833_05060 [Glycomyces tarimensis]
MTATVTPDPVEDVQARSAPTASRCQARAGDAHADVGAISMTANNVEPRYAIVMRAVRSPMSIGSLHRGRVRIRE